MYQTQHHRIAITLPEYGHLLPTLAFIVQENKKNPLTNTVLIPSGTQSFCRALKEQYYPHVTIHFQEIPHAPYHRIDPSTRYTVLSHYKSTLEFARAAREFLHIHVPKINILIVDSALEFLLDTSILKKFSQTVIFHAVLPISIRILRQGNIPYTQMLGPVGQWPKLFAKALRLFWRVNRKQRYKILPHEANKKFPLTRYIFTTREVVSAIPAIRKTDLHILPEPPKREETIPEPLRKFIEQHNAVTYLSLGTIFERAEDVYAKILERIPTEKPLVIACSQPMQSILLRLCRNRNTVFIGHSLPQQYILKHADQFFTHGGFNSINEALQNQVPLTCIPAMFEQELNAKIAERIGRGTILKF